jgi:hypothetical protein
VQCLVVFGAIDLEPETLLFLPAWSINSSWNLLCQPLAKCNIPHEMKLQARAAMDSFRLSSKSERPPFPFLP